MIPRVFHKNTDQQSQHYWYLQKKIVPGNGAQAQVRLYHDLDHIEANPKQLETQEPPEILIKTRTIICYRSVNRKQETDKRGQKQGVAEEKTLL
jgi:hypothetical protein